MIEQIEKMILANEDRIKGLEDKLSGSVLPVGDDGYIVDKINYFLGVNGGLNQALFIVRTLGSEA
jgi:hypothetical protein